MVIWLPRSGPEPKLTERLKPMLGLVEAKGFRCEASGQALNHAQILRCRSVAMGPDRSSQSQLLEDN